ncbi:MAG: hypothetical protein WD627_11790 [Actinomycetota bacterium]
MLHNISDPEKFWSLNGFPETVKLRASFQDPTGTRAVCLFEGNSVEAVQDTLETAAGAISDNEYFEVVAQKAMGLPS